LKVFKAGAVTLFEGFPEHKIFWLDWFGWKSHCNCSGFFFSSVFSVVIATYNQSNPLPCPLKGRNLTGNTKSKNLSAKQK
jgi:hypothetical protein